PPLGRAQAASRPSHNAGTTLRMPCAPTVAVTASATIQKAALNRTELVEVEGVLDRPHQPGWEDVSEGVHHDGEFHALIVSGTMGREINWVIREFDWYTFVKLRMPKVQHPSARGLGS